MITRIRGTLESQAMLDELVVKSSDDIVVMKKTMEENKIAIEILENKIDKINEELDRTRKEIEDKGKGKKFRKTFKFY